MSFALSNVINFPQNTLVHNIPQDIYNPELLEDVLLLGGILSDTKHVWHAKGPCLEVKHISTGKKVGAWTFGCILKDSNTKIVCVDEVKRLYGRLSLLAVGINCTISGGLICIFDAFGSKVIRAVQIGEQITSLHVIDSGCSTSNNTEGPLKYFDGIIAVGCQGGNVLLVDICRQICDDALQNVDLMVVRDELCPCQLRILNKNHLPKLQKYAAKSVKEGQHLALHLNAVLNGTTEHFVLKGEKGEDRLHVNQSEVEISSLYYAPQLSSLFIGYNFGAFQIWYLPNLELTYTSPVCDDHLAVTHFAIQEPADDPKAYCYVWVSYSNMFLFQHGVPYAVMYSLYFDKKQMVPGKGQVYEDFQHCSVRFQIELGPLNDSKNASKFKGGFCMSLQSISKSPIIKDLHSLALCLISWTLWINKKETETCVLLFDLNQWYKEQMPNEFNWKNCSNYSLSHGIKGSMLDVKLDKRSISQFIGIQRLEEHFCPTSLSYDIWGLYENSIHKFHNQSLQQSLLGQLEIGGPLCLVRPNEIFEQIVSLGLTPLFNDVSLKIPNSMDSQRKLILDVVLEQRLIGFLCRCASEWANGSFSSAGLSIEFIISWAFQRATTIKENCDIYCIPLFDYSGSSLDNNTIMLLNNCITQIKNICCFYKHIFTKLHHFIYDHDVVHSEYVCLQSLCVYFEIILWLVNVGLLPEYQAELRPELSHRIAPYLVDDLTEFYNKKRAHLKQLSRETFVERDSLLFIDNLINQRCGGHLLQQQWQQDGGSGLYPPPSLQSMLRSYLIAGPDDIHKHSLVAYVLLDIAMTLDEYKYTDAISLMCRFPQIFQVSQSNIKIIQGFWHIDHNNFEVGLENILDPCVQADDIQDWHHKVVMRSLMLQEQYTSALLYMQIRKPPITDEKDVLTVISLFVSKSLLDEAFLFEHQHRNSNEEVLLKHLFSECNKNGLLHGVLYRCLTSAEEQHFFKYLEMTHNPNSEDLKVFYYLLRSRFIEAFDSHDIYKKRKPESQGLIGQRRATTSDSIVKMFKTLLPEVNRNLVDFIRKERNTLWKQVDRPTPLSVFVHNSKENVKYKSTTIYAALAKAKQTFNDTLNNSQKEVKTEETPFLRTPKPLRPDSHFNARVIHSETIEINEHGEDSFGPSPSKRIKLASREATSSTRSNINVSSRSLLNTPIVKRKVSLDKSQANAYTPQSILKSKKTGLQEQESAMRLFQTSRRVSLGLSSRKSLARTPPKTHVKFDDLPYSASSSELSKLDISSKEVTIYNNSSEDTFYSPNTSTNENELNSDTIQTDNFMQKDIEDKELKSTARIAVGQDIVEPQGVVVSDIILQKPHIPGDQSFLLQSPKSRRSYKRSIGESSPVRHSPRLTQKHLEDKSLSEHLDTTTTTSTSGTSESFKVTPGAKIGGRKSLNRAVLEFNTFIRAKHTVSNEDNDESGQTDHKNDSLVSDVNISSLSSIAVNDQTEEMLGESENHLKTELDTNKVAVRKPIRGRQSITRSFTNSNKDEVTSDLSSQPKQDTSQKEANYSKTVTHTSFTRIFEELSGRESSISSNSMITTTTTEFSSGNLRDTEQNLSTANYGIVTSESIEEMAHDDTSHHSNVLPECQIKRKNTFEDVESATENNSTSEDLESSNSSIRENNDNSKAHKDSSNSLSKTDSDGDSSDSSDEGKDEHEANEDVRGSEKSVHKNLANEFGVSDSDTDSSDSPDDDKDELAANKDILVGERPFSMEPNQNDVIEIGSSSEDEEKGNSSNSEDDYEKKTHHSQSNASESDHADLDDLNIMYEEQNSDSKPESEESNSSTENSSSDMSDIKPVSPTENLIFDKETHGNPQPVLDDDIIKEIYDFEDDQNPEKSSDLEVTSNVFEVSVIAENNGEKCVEYKEFTIKVTEDLLETDILVENVVGPEVQPVSEAMEVDESEVDDCVFKDTHSGNSIDLVNEAVVQLEEPKNESEFDTELAIGELASTEGVDEKHSLEVQEQVSDLDNNSATNKLSKEQTRTVELGEDRNRQEIVEAIESVTDIHKNEDKAHESEDPTTPPDGRDVLKAMLVDKEIQTTSKKSESLEEKVEVHTETTKGSCSGKTTFDPQTPMLVVSDARKTYLRSRQKSTDSNSNNQSVIVNRRLILDDQVKGSPELVVNIVRNTYLKKDKLKTMGTEQSDVAETDTKPIQTEEEKKGIENSQKSDETISSPKLEIGQVSRTYVKHLTPQQLIVKKVKKTYINRLRDPQTSAVETTDVEEQTNAKESCDTVSSSSDVLHSNVTPMSVKETVKTSSSILLEPNATNRNLVDTTEAQEVNITESSCSTSSKPYSTTSTSVDTPTKRLTRRSSLSKPNEGPESSQENIIVSNKTEATKQVPKKIERRDKRSTSKTNSVGDTLENGANSAKNLRSTRSKSVDPRELKVFGGQTSFSKADKPSSVVTEDLPSLTSFVKTKRDIRKTRSASVDLDDRRKVVILPRCSLEDTHIEDSNNTKSTKHRTRQRSMSTRTASVSQLPAIDETEEDKRPGKVKNSEAYTLSRRLTRSQASMLKNVEDNLSMTVDDSISIQPDVDEIDPINLLDKSPFKGKPDPEEQKIYEQSSPSNSTVSSRPARRKSRSVSVASDTSLPPSTSASIPQISTPTKARRKATPSTDVGTSLGLRSRQKRKTSVDDEKSNASDISESPSPPKRTRSREKSVDQEDSASVKSEIRSSGRRKRTGSISSVKSSKSTGSVSSATKRSTRKNLKTTELPDISEEKNSETTESSDKSITGRQTRRRKKL